MKARVAVMLAMLMLSACVSPRGGGRDAAPGAELVGRQVRLETAGGQVSTLQFMPEGVVRARFGSREVSGQWHATGDRLCFAWTGAPRECWPYSRPFPRGETISLTSDRGNAVRVTLQ